VRIFFLITLFLILPLHAGASPKLEESASPKKLEHVEQAGDKIEALALMKEQQTELLLLKEQFLIVREFNDDFLAIVLWSLSVLLTLTIVLLGFNWFQGSRAIKRELASINTELNSSIEISKQELKYEINGEVEKLEQLLEDKVKRISKQAIEPLKNKIESLEHKILMLEYDSLEADVKNLQENNLLSTAVKSCAELIECAIQIDWDWKLSNAIDLMKGLFDEVDGKGIKEARIDTQDIIEIEAQVKKVPDSHRILRDSLLKRLREFH